MVCIVFVMCSFQTDAAFQFGTKCRQELRLSFGGRLHSLTTGSAPVSKRTRDLIPCFLRRKLLLSLPAVYQPTTATATQAFCLAGRLFDFLRLCFESCNCSRRSAFGLPGHRALP